MNRTAPSDPISAEADPLAVVAADFDSPQAQRLARIWAPLPGWRGWIATVDHKVIGQRYLLTAFAFLILGGVEALALRVQLSGPDRHWLSPEQYNALFTMHGITMIFLYALPVLSGFSNYVWPLVLGARDMAFPRLNAFSYWIYLCSGLFLYASFLTGRPPDAGWFSYVPYASEYSPGDGTDIYALGMLLFGISTTGGSINFIVTLLRLRAPGMSIDRVPVLVWGTLTASVGNLFAVPAVSLAFFMLWLDRNVGTDFFNVAQGGQPLLWQHLFWIFGHPWVYAVVLPAQGIVSDCLPVFCRRPLVGYNAVVLATVLTMFIGFGTWVHHMFAVGLPPQSLSFFSTTSLVITIPSAVSVFAWLATIALGSPVFTTAFLYFAGFVLLFVIGGVSGFMTASVPVDWQLTDTYFIVAHLHYVLLGINVFPVLGAVYYWFPKMTGKLLDERLGRWNFWTLFVGFNLAFFPMHIAGLLGMPRRIYTYPSGLGWEWPNIVTSAGSALFAIGFLLFLINVGISLKRGQRAGANPWHAPTLEWLTPSPPPVYNFVVLPRVASRHPLWEEQLATPRRSALQRGLLLDRGHQTIATSSVDAKPDAVLAMPGDAYSPLLLSLALSVVCVGLLWHSVSLAVLGIVASLVCTLAWLWPEADDD